MPFGAVPPDNVVKIMLFAFVGLCWLGVPFLIYFYIGFYKLSKSVMIRKRQPRILRLQTILLFLCLTIFFPLMMLDFAELKELKEYQTLISRINRFVFHFGPYGVFLCIGWRFWHIFYDLKYASSQKNSEWKFHLNESLVQRNFWLTHKKDYGCVMWMQKRFYLFYVVTSLIQGTVFQIVINTRYDLVGFFVAMFFISIAVSMIFIAWIKKPTYEDNFFIGKELKTLAIGTFASLPISTASIFYGIYGSPEFFFFILTMYTAFITFSASWFSFWFIPRKIMDQEQRIELIDRFGLGEDSVLSKSKSQNVQIHGVIRRISASPGTIKRITFALDSVISVQRTFKMFMQHLVREFSTECLLCFAEVVQYKFMVRQRVNIIDPALIPTKQNFAEECPLSDIIPISAINVNGFKEKYRARDDPFKLITEAKNVCQALYRKYIVEGAELEVNISYQQRARLSTRMADPQFFTTLNITVDELFSLYDAVAETMYRLMDGSFLRFRQADTWASVKAILTTLQQEQAEKAASKQSTTAGTSLVGQNIEEEA